MKLSKIAQIFLLTSICCFAQSDPGEDIIIPHLRHEERRQPRLIIQQVLALAPDQQARILNVMVQKVQEMRGKEEVVYDITPNDYIEVAAAVLAATGTDEQIIAAFGRLSEFGRRELDAATALGSCKGEAGPAIVEELAMQRLPAFAAALQQTPPEATIIDQSTGRLANSIFFLVIRLAVSEQPSALAAAYSIRDAVARQLLPRWKEFLTAVDQAILSEILRERRRTGSSIPVVWTPPTEDKKSGNLQAPTSTTAPPPSPILIWPWIIGLALAGLGFGLWFRNKNAR